jgi:CRP/FNR family transcriptional regulator, cyclic AMP receptor protein
VVLMVVRPMGVVEPLPLVIVRTGQTPVRQGEPCPDLWVVESGVFALSIVDPDGRTMLLDLLGPGDTLGVPGGHPLPWTATALRPARLRPIDSTVALAASCARLASIVTDLAWFDITERVERRLLDLAQRLGRPAPGGVVIPIRLTQDELASMVGATRESANRAVRALVARGAIDVVGRGRYIVRTQLRLVDDDR